jgi:hypothetical protein
MAGNAGAATVAVPAPDGSLPDWQPANKITASAEISDPHVHRVKRFAWFIVFLVLIWSCEWFRECCNADHATTSAKTFSG